MRSTTRVPNCHDLIDVVFYEDADLHPSVAVPGLSLSMDKILGKVASGTMELSMDDRRIIYDQPDKPISAWSPDVREMTLAEVADVRRSLSAESERLTKKIKSDEEEQRRQQEQENERKLRERISAEIQVKQQKPVAES